ncbi:MAG: hypothetical protein BWY66_02099 [bacterium ADurb.Bin374]|nr:MAG: hypothetical protein BWY66_02099 [bacterium ADurb.Bin374]
MECGDLGWGRACDGLASNGGGDGHGAKVGNISAGGCFDRFDLGRDGIQLAEQRRLPCEQAEIGEDRLVCGLKEAVQRVGLKDQIDCFGVGRRLQGGRDALDARGDHVVIGFREIRRALNQDFQSGEEAFQLREDVLILELLRYSRITRKCIADHRAVDILQGEQDVCGEAQGAGEETELVVEQLPTFFGGIEPFGDACVDLVLKIERDLPELDELRIFEPGCTECLELGLFAIDESLRDFHQICRCLGEL